MPAVVGRTMLRQKAVATCCALGVTQGQAYHLVGCLRLLRRRTLDLAQPHRLVGRTPCRAVDLERRICVSRRCSSESGRVRLHFATLMLVKLMQGDAHYDH